MGREGRRERGAAGLSGTLTTERCFACGGTFAAAGGDTHTYLLSSPGCWAAYGALLAREYQDPVLFGAAHRLTVDAYALQHPGDPLDRRARQSVWVHYAALYCAFEREEPLAAITPLMRTLAGRDYPALPAAPRAFAVTLADVAARPVVDHVAAVQGWARAAYDAWADLWQPTRDLLRLL